MVNERQEMLDESATLYFGPWYRRSPFFEATRRAGCTAYDVYNHMLLPSYFDDPLTEYWALLNDVTVWDVAVERTVEIGTVRAIGLRRSGIRSLFVAEGLVLGVAGAVLGILAALAAAWAVNAMGLTWTPPARIDEVPLAVRVAQEPAMLAVSAAGLVIVAALSAIVPAARASRMNIVDALRHV